MPVDQKPLSNVVKVHIVHIVQMNIVMTDVLLLRRAIQTDVLQLKFVIVQLICAITIQPQCCLLLILLQTQLQQLLK